MLQALFGSSGSEKVLGFIASRGEGYAREIARSSGMGLYPIQRQLDRLEKGGILTSRTVGRIRIYSFNSACPFLKELQQLLDKAQSSVTPVETKRAAPPLEVPGTEMRRMTQAELADYIQERLRRG